MINAFISRTAVVAGAMALSTAAMAAPVTIATKAGTIADASTTSYQITLSAASSASFAATIRGNASQPGDILSFSLFDAAEHQISLSAPAQDVSVFNRETITNYYANLAAGVYTLKLTSAAVGGGTYSISGSYNVATTPVPEADVYSLAFAGVAVAGLLVRRRKTS
jgi:hypothetical protein